MQHVKSTQNANTQALGYIWTICFIVGLGGFLFGQDTAVVSGAIGLVKTKFTLNADMEGLVVSSAVLGCIFGTVSSGWMADRYGRRMVLRIAGVLFLVSALGSAVVTSAVMLIVARIIGGVGIGIASVVGPLYMAEICPPQVRGRMISLYQLAITIGILVAFATNAFILRWGAGVAGNVAPLRWLLVDEMWRGMFGVCAIPALIFLILIMFIPESPRWLLKQGREAEATKLLVRILGAVEKDREMQEIKKTLSEHKGSFSELFSKRLRRPLVIGVMMTVFGNLSGINVIMYYAPKLLGAAGVGTQGALEGAVAIGVMNIIFTFVAIFLVDRAGRRPLLLVGVSGCAIGLNAAALLFKFFGGAGLLIPLLLHVACFAFSYGAIGWIVTAELFPNSIRGRAAGLVTMFGWSTGFLISQSLPRLLESVGGAGVFAIYGLSTAVAVLFIWRSVPETKGRTLEEIEMSWTS